MIKCLGTIILTFLLCFPSLAQQETDSVKATLKDPRRNEILINAVVKWSLVQGDLQAKFKNFVGFGGGFMFKTKSEWYIGAEGTFMFNDDVKNANAVIEDIVTSNGSIIGQNGRVANIFISQRGMDLQFLKIGKLLWKKPVLNGNPSSGIMGMVGFGILQHQYRIIDRNGTAPQLSDAYTKGYDQLRNGFAVNPFIGYVYFDRDKFINFILGVEYNLAWTQSRRSWDFLLMKKDDSQTTDQLISLKLIWNIPIRKKLSRDYYYF